MKLTVKRHRRYFLVVWDHFKTAPMFFLIPEHKITPYTAKVLRKAHCNHITERLLPKYTNKLREFLFSPLHRWCDDYQVNSIELFDNFKKYKLLGVCFTGQLG